MAYSDLKVIAGGLAHIPIIIGFFYFIQNKVFAKKTEAPNTIDIKAKSPENDPQKNTVVKTSAKSSKELGESIKTDQSQKSLENTESPNPAKDNSISSQSPTPAFIENLSKEKMEIPNKTATEKGKSSSNTIENPEPPSSGSQSEESPSSNKLDQ